MIRSLLERWFKVRNKHDALNVRRKLAIVYAIVGWNMFGVMFYVLLKDKIPKNPEGRRMAYGSLTGTPSTMHVYKVTGMTLTDEFDVMHKTKDARIQKEENEKATADEY